MTWEPVWCQSNRQGTTFFPCRWRSCYADHNDKVSLSLSPLCQNITKMQLQATGLLTAFPQDGDTAEAPCKSVLPTYRVLLLPQVRPLGAAHLREEGVEVGRFPLAAAPVFHPAEGGKTLSRWEFANHSANRKSSRRKRRNFAEEFTLRVEKKLFYGGYRYFYFFVQVQRKVWHKPFVKDRDSGMIRAHIWITCRSVKSLEGLKKEELLKTAAATKDFFS